MKIIKIIIPFLLYINFTLLIFTDSPDFTVTRTINWKEKIIFFDITKESDLQKGYAPNNRYNIEKETEAKIESLLFNSIPDIIVDSRHTLYDLLENNHELYKKINLNMLNCKKEYAHFSNNMKKVNIRYSWPLYGENGMISCFVQYNHANALPDKLGFIPSKKYTGILIYAAGEYKLYGEKTKGTLKPVFFPDIYDEDMNLVFSKSNCEPDFLKKWGMVEYTDQLDEKKFIDRIGTTPLYTSPLKLFGKTTSDLILSRDVVFKILCLEENKQLLREGRIVIVYNSL